MAKLPFVTETMGETIGEELILEPGNEYISKILGEVTEENPNIASFISQFSLTAGDDYAKQTTAHCGLLVYKMLKNQLLFTGFLFKVKSDRLYVFLTFYLFFYNV